MANPATTSAATEAWALMQRLFGPQRKRFMALAAEHDFTIFDDLFFNGVFDDFPGEFANIFFADIVEAGADAVFAEAAYDLATFEKFSKAVDVPLLANITEFGKTPLFTVAELRSVDVDIVLYPLSAFRAMNKAAELVYKTIRSEGTQKSALDHMQTREELYQAIDYYKYEEALDKFQSEKNG